MALISAILKQTYRKTDLMRASERQMDAGIGIFGSFGVLEDIFEALDHSGTPIRGNQTSVWVYHNGAVSAGSGARVGACFKSHRGLWVRLVGGEGPSKQKVSDERIKGRKIECTCPPADFVWAHQAFSEGGYPLISETMRILRIWPPNGYGRIRIWGLLNEYGYRYTPNEYGYLSGWPPETNPVAIWSYI